MINDIKDITSFKWATVAGTSPLAITLDGDTSPLALVPDSLVDPLALSVGDRVRVELSLRKVVIHGAANGGVEAGRIEITARAAAPAGWLLCQGQSLLRSQYPRLFEAIGTVYGAADGTHFSVPNPPGRVVVGLDATQAEFNVIGKTGGEKSHILTVAEMPSHQHTERGADNVPGLFSQSGSMYGVAAGDNRNTGLTGGGAAHNNLPPYIVMNYIIKI